jgi:uracil-DNA glycosylase family 4
VGPAGKKLWEELKRVGIERKEVFACNAVCCFPHGTPSKEHVQACRGNLYKQVQLCNPLHILALGLTANWTLGQDRPMREMHGTWYPLRWFSTFEGFADEISVFATYHPAAVLRDRTLTRAFRDDLREFADVVNYG